MSAVTCLKESGCGVCGSDLPPRARRWCSSECRTAYYANHRWTQARHEAMTRAKRRCIGCGKPAEEVDHIIERRGFPMHQHTCLHHQANLRALCHDCHVNRSVRFPLAGDSDYTPKESNE